MIHRRKYLSVINLESDPPGQLVVRIPYGGKYEISNTQWSRMPNINLVGVAVSPYTFFRAKIQDIFEKIREF